MHTCNETWITLSQAAALMKLSVRTIIRRVDQGQIIGKLSSDLPFTTDGHQNYLVLLEHLPPKAQYDYHISQINPAESFSVDLISPAETFGTVWLSNFLDVSSLLAKASQIRSDYRSSRRITEKLTELALSYGISLKTLYRYEGRPGICQVSKLYLDPVYMQDHIPKDMCLLTIDLAYYLWLSKDTSYKQNDILRECKKFKDTFSCSECVYREGSSAHMKCSQTSIAPIPVCRIDTDYIRVPNTRHPINNLLKHVPKQLICFCREGVRTWNAKYGHFIIRDKPLLVNLNWQGDHHVFDCFVRVRQSVIKGGIEMQREVLVRPVLTAWMDTASGSIVGWVISILPNASTIAEAFCRACVYTLGDEFHGLPSSILVDCGKDYKSVLLEDIPEDFNDSLSDESFLNKRFAGLGMLPALNVTVHHALPYHPQSKSIERMFGTIESRWISKLPGWCHHSVVSRPVGFSNMLKKQWKDGKLYTMEEFVSCFATKILPEYHNTPHSEDQHTDVIASLTDNDDPEVWHTAPSSLSPLDLYKRLPKSRNITPNWRTMSLLKMQRKNGCSVTRQGILFRNEIYWDDELSWIIGSKADILFNAPARKEDTPLSVTVIYQGKFIAEARPARHFQFIDEDPALLQAHYDAKKQHQKELTSIYTRLSKVMKLCGLSIKDQFRQESYSAVIDMSRNKNLATDMSSDIPESTITQDYDDLPETTEDAGNRVGGD